MGGGQFFLKGEGQFFLKFLSQVFSLQDEIEERKIKFGRWILGGGAIFLSLDENECEKKNLFEIICLAGEIVTI